MTAQIEGSERRLVVITDPHISDDNSYFVRSKGAILEKTDILPGGIEIPGVQIFVKDGNGGGSPFSG